METLTRIIGSCLLIMVSFNSLAAGLLTPKDGSQQSLELAEHHVEVVVENGYATTTVTQIFHNPHAMDLEAIYSFPVPTKGAVGDFTIWIDEKPVTGEVVKKQRAREIYEEQKAAGKDAGITEQNGYQTFETSVSPIRAKQDTKIQLRYFQVATVDLGVGRWVYQLEDGGVDEEALAFWNTDSQVTKAFSFDFLLRSGYPVEAIRLPYHGQANIQKISDNEWRATINKQGSTNAPIQIAYDKKAQEMENLYLMAHPAASMPIPVSIEENEKPQPILQKSHHLDQDIVVYWKMQSGLPGSLDLVAYRPEANGKGTFMLTFTPGEDMQPIEQGGDWNFVLDISGSMNGKYAALAEGVSQAIEKMRPQDRFRIILFNSSARELTPGYVNATPESIKHYLNEIQNVKPESGTNLYAGLKRALVDLDRDRASAIILVTDGVANVGNTHKKDFFKLLEKQDIRLFTFIMGNSANQPMLEPLARHSGGFAMNVSNSDDIIGRVLQAKEKLSHKAFHDVEIDIDGVKVSNLTPNTVGSLYRGQQLVMMGHYWHAGEAEISMTAKLSGEKKSYRTGITFPDVDDNNPELERLWAYAKIETLGERMEDFAGEDHKQAITDIALEYGLVTEYTSMLVLREEEFQAYNIERKNQQRVAKENQARQTRSKQPVKSNRADKQQPMYKKPRPSFGGGGGSLGWWLLACLGWMVLIRRK